MTASRRPRLRWFLPRVEALESREVPATFTVTNTGDNGGVDPAPGDSTGTLRQAIVDANATPGADTIDFAIAAGGVQTIALTAALPAVTEAVTVDGYTEPGATPAAAGSAAVLTVVLDGGGTVATGLALQGHTGSTLRGLVISRFTGAGVEISGGGGHTVAGNFIGTDATGGTAVGNGTGVRVTGGSTLNNIGGTAEGDRNVISGNLGAGIALTGGGVSGNIVRRNSIGTDPTGMVAVGNGGDGILIDAGASDNVIGGVTPGNPPGTRPFDFSGAQPPDGNLISGNAGNGVRIANGATGNNLFGNFIGTDATGIAPLGNTLDGVAIVSADGNRLAGTDKNLDPFIFYNVVSGNLGNGLRITDSDNTIVHANFFGLGSDDMTPVGNVLNGVVVEGSSTNTAFGGAIPLGNVIAANGQNGVVVQGTAGKFIASNNFTGVGAFVDFTNLGNALDGFHITATGGGTVLKVGNIISRNGDDGIEVSGDAQGVQIVQNMIGLNTDGMSPMPNGGNGIEIGGNAHDITVGGVQTDFSIVPTGTISANGGYGIAVSGTAHDIRINFSYIGTNSSGGPVAFGNKAGGVYLGPSTTGTVIGSTDPTLPTVISGNVGDGVTIDGSSGNTIVGARIGVGENGGAVANTGAGVRIVGGSGNVIGGTAAGEGNVVAANGGIGIAVGASPADVTAVGNRIAGNSIYANGGLGIDLASDGVTPNGANPRAFPNNGQNTPVLAAASIESGTISIRGTLTSRPATTYRLEFFATPAGGAQAFLGSATVTTDATGAAAVAVSFTAPDGVRAGAAVTATATDAVTGDTSEFAAAVVLRARLLAVGQDVGGTGVVNVYGTDGVLRFADQPFGPFAGGVRVATADVTGDGTDDVIVGAGPGGGPRVVVLDGTIGVVVADFFAYESTFTGGVFVAAGDLDGDGRAEVVVGAGAGGGPRVRVFDPASGFAVARDFFAYEPTFTGGVTVAVGDATGDGVNEVVTGTGAGGAPRVNVYGGPGLALQSSFFAYAPTFTGGVFVTVNEGLIGTGAGAGGGPQVNVFAPGAGGYTALFSFFAFEPTSTGGVRVGSTGGADPLLYAGAGPGGGPRVLAYDPTAAVVEDFFAFPRTFTGGVFVG